ncbi:MAG: methionyl-tRNA formyltransferase [Candidatus Spyradocola sp.]
MRIVFMGTPEFAVPSLEALIGAGYEVVAAVTQPDRPVGRKKTLTPPPVKVCAQAHGVPVLQFERIRRKEGREALTALQPDLFVTAAFGQILSKAVLDIPRLGTINVHASLLPQYRGSAPINWCILSGESKAGVTTMMTNEGIDTGDMLLRDEVEIGQNETAEELTGRLSKLGAQTLLRTLQALENGTLVRTPQNEAEASYQPMLTREMGEMDWSRSARQLHDQVRGLYPWPGAYTTMDGGVLKVWVSRVSDMRADAEPGTVVKADAKEGLFVACGTGVLQIVEMQAPGSKRMNARDYLRGKPMQTGVVLGGSHAE